MAWKAIVKGLDFSGPIRKTIKDASAVQNAPSAIICEAFSFVLAGKENDVMFMQLLKLYIILCNKGNFYLAKEN